MDIVRLKPQDNSIYLRAEVLSDYKTDTYYPNFKIYLTKKYKGKRVVSYITKHFNKLSDALEYAKRVDIEKEFEEVGSFNLTDKFKLNREYKFIQL